MASFNSIVLLGNLTRDPEMRYTPSNSAVVEFGIACNRKWKDANGKDREEAMFIDVTAFGKPAEILNQYCHKGDLLFVQGRLKLDTWEDKQGGGKRSKHRVVIDSFQLMPNGKRQDTQPPRQDAGARTKPTTQGDPIGDSQQFKEDDIPF